MEPRVSSYFGCARFRPEKVIGTPCVGANEVKEIKFGDL